MKILTATISMDADIVAAFKDSPEEKGQIILHCNYTPKSQFSKFSNIRISKITFLLDCGSSHKSQLFHAEGIPFGPDSKRTKVGVNQHFTLVFEGLPKSCREFNFLEMEGIGFNDFKTTNSISRNKMDVYYITLI